MGYNEPEDIRNFDQDPRSPYYDDGGQEAWCDQRYDELLKDVSEIDCLDPDVVSEIVVSYWDDKSEDGVDDKKILLAKLGEYIERSAVQQSDKDWENLEPFDEPDEPRVPNDFM